MFGIPIAVAKLALKKVGVAATKTTIKAAAALIAAGKRVTAASVWAVARAMPTIKKALKAVGIPVTYKATEIAVVDWMRGICANPLCTNPTRDGNFGDILCADCADKVGRQFYGPKP